MEYDFDYRETLENVTELIAHHLSRGFTLEQAVSQTIDDLELVGCDPCPVNFIVSTLALNEYLAASNTIFSGIVNHFNELRSQLSPLQWQQLLPPSDYAHFETQLQHVENALKTCVIRSVIS
jgi:hypothetical protein